MTAIHIKFPSLTLKAGPRALARIRQNGLSAADVGTLPGAAGGPKALGIQGLDLALFGEWLPAVPRALSTPGRLNCGTVLAAFGNTWCECPSSIASMPGTLAK